MIEVEKIETWGFEHAIRGMRNPMNSWDNSDSGYLEFIGFYTEQLKAGKQYDIGNNDLQLMRKLYKAGPEHRKYLRQIFVSMDITAPLYWWKEFDTYKVGVVANSCSTMHKIHDKIFEIDDFSHEHLLYTGEGDNPIDYIIKFLNYYRERYIETGRKEYWWQMIQLLPTSYNQKRTVTMNYENVMSIILQRTGHKLDEWRKFVEIISTLPYIKEIREEENNE